VNIICSDDGWDNSDERLKCGVLKTLLYASYQGDTVVFWDDWPDLCTNVRAGPREPTTLLILFLCDSVDCSRREQA
jgi:hypothetical protein